MEKITLYIITFLDFLIKTSLWAALKPEWNILIAISIGNWVALTAEWIFIRSLKINKKGRK